MKPVKFDEANYLDMRMTPHIYELRAINKDYEYTVSCHRLSFWERLRVLFTGRVWAMRLPNLTILSTEKSKMI